MARTRPTTKAHLLAISGVGKRKLYMYGDDFLAAIRDAR
jgi:superfamily II DNA helicase RecQ